MTSGSQQVQLDVRPLGPTIGAEIHGLDLSAPLPDEVIAAIRSAWLDHLVVFFPDQRLDDDQQLAFAQRFGELTENHPVEAVVGDRPEVHTIHSSKDRTDFWHTDVTFMTRPPAASMLRAVVVPDAGGDTMWADTRAAYDELAPPLQRLCDELTAVHHDAYYAQAVAEGRGNVWEGKRLERLLPVSHPVVRVHPESGRRNLFVNPKFTVALGGFPQRQGDGLLQVLYDQMTDPRFVVRYRWRPGTLAFWDNRATMHYGVHDYGDETREMHRVTLRGDRPVGPG